MILTAPFSSNVHFAPYHFSSALIIPSRKEAMSIVALEAGITGTPVLLTDQCGFNEVESCGGGLVVSPSVSGIEEGLKALIENEMSLGEMGSKLKVLTESHYTWSSFVKLYYILYIEVLGKK